jgi:DNA-binding MarR family transcriptional regulator
MQLSYVKLGQMKDRFALDRFLPFRLNRLAAEVSERLSRVYAARFDLDIPQWRVLATLAGEGESTAQAIVQSTRTHKSTISRAVQQLEDKHLIERAVSRRDRRAHVLKLTAEGRRLFRQLKPLVLGYQEKLLGSIEVKAADALLRGVDALEGSLGLRGEEQR